MDRTDLRLSISLTGIEHIFFSEQIFKGNFSILLENITVADTGIYRCVVYSSQDVGEISVTVQHVGKCLSHYK